MSRILKTVRNAVLLQTKFLSDVKGTYEEQNSSKSGRAELHVLS